MNSAELAEKPIEDILEYIKTGGKIVDATLPTIVTIFQKIGEAFQGVMGNKSPKARLRRIELLEAQNLGQKSYNSLNDSIIKSQAELIEKLNERIMALENK